MGVPIERLPSIHRNGPGLKSNRSHGCEQLGGGEARAMCDDGLMGASRTEGISVLLAPHAKRV
jgi:hypothetical protein